MHQQLKDQIKNRKSPKAHNLAKDNHSFRFSENPTAGVFFVETQLEGHVVVKAIATIAQELFGSKIASFLELKTPQIQLIEYKADFKNPIKTYWSKCKKYLKEFATKHELFVKERKLNKELYRAFFLLIELVEGAYSLEDLMNHEELAREILTNPVVLNDIGRMVVMDIIINNCDRFPLDLIWEHEGNSSNVLFSIINTNNKGSSRVACIDQPYMAVIDDKQKKEYLTKIEKFAEACCSSSPRSDMHENPYLTQIWKYISDVTGVNLDESSTSGGDHDDNKRCNKEILQGIMDAVQFLKGLNRTKLEEFKTQVERMKTGSDCDGVYFQSVLTIDVDFLEEAIERMTFELR